MSGTTGRPEGGDRARAERAGCSPSEAPLRLERYVGWNLNTGCEVQRKGMEAEGEGAEGKERASRSVQAPLTPSGPSREPGPREACVLPLSSTLPPLPMGLERALGATQQARRTLPTAPRESNGQGSRDGHHGRHPRPLPEARRGAFGDLLFQARGFRPRPFPGHGLAVSEVVRPDVERASGKDRVETECLLSTCQSKATSMAGSRVSRRMSSEGRRPAGDPQEPGSHLPAGGALGADRSAFLT